MAQTPLLKWLAERPALRAIMVMRAADELATQMMNVAIGWYVYAATHDPMSLAYIGLAQFLPDICLLLFAGQSADRFDRRRILAIVLGAQVACLGAFALWSASAPTSVWPVYLLLILSGAAHAFFSPAISASLPHTVPTEEFPRAVAATSSAFQICSIAGPAIGGALYAVSGPGMFVVAAGFHLVALTQVRHLTAGHAKTADGEDGADKSILAGIRYIRSNHLLLGLISLDLFAVLLGGVSALLPIYARDILDVGPIGLGWLRCAPGIGAALVGLMLAHRTVERHAGPVMLGCVAGFGAATLVFAVSSNFWLSLAALGVVGGFDMVSIVIRQTLVQLSTPDAMRGRVSAVNWLFIGASAQLGEFESGLAAALLGTVPAAVLGGMGTLAIVGLWAVFFPEVRKADRLPRPN